MMRGARRCLLFGLLAAFACSHRVALPPPTLPLTPSADEPFRRSAPAPLEGLPVWSPPRVETRVLTNGMRIVVAERRDRPIVSLRYANRAAALFAKPYPAGLPVLVGDVLLEGTRVDGDRILAHQSVGGVSPSVWTHEEGTTIALDIPSSAFAPAVDMIAGIVRRPALDVRGIEAAGRQQHHWLFERSDRSGFLVRAIERGLLFGSAHPWATNARTWQRGLERVTAAQVRDYHRRMYAPDASALVVVGDVATEQVFALAEQRFGDWQAGRPTIESQALASVPQRREVHAVLADGEQTSVYVVQPGVSASHPDFHALGVAADLVGGYLSRFNKAMRHERGATYGGAAGEAHGHRDGGYVRFMVVIENDGFVQAVAALRAEIGRLRSEEASEAELTAAKNAYLASFSLSSTKWLANALAQLDMQNLGPDWLARIESEVAGITAARIRALARQYFDPERASIIALGNPRITQSQLEQMGQVRPYTIGRRR